MEMGLIHAQALVCNVDIISMLLKTGEVFLCKEHLVKHMILTV